MTAEWKFTIYRIRPIKRMVPNKRTPRRTSKQTEQRERIGAITAITLRPAIIQGCGKTEDRQHPYFRKISQPLPTPCA